MKEKSKIWQDIAKDITITNEIHPNYKRCLFLGERFHLLFKPYLFKHGSNESKSAIVNMCIGPEKQTSRALVISSSEFSALLVCFV